MEKRAPNLGRTGLPGRGKPPPPWVWAVIARVAEGQSMSAAARAEGHPHEPFLKWVRKSVEVAEAFDAAQMGAGHAAAARIQALVEELEAGDWGKEDATKVRALAVAIDALKWLASKLHPAQFGERKVEQAPLLIQINTSLDLGQGPGKFAASVADIPMAEVESSDLGAPEALPQPRPSQAPVETEGGAADEPEFKINTSLEI